MFQKLPKARVPTINKFYVRMRLIVITFVLLSTYFTWKYTTTHDKDGEGGLRFHAIKRALLQPHVSRRRSAMTLNDTLLNINVNCSAQHFYDVSEWTLKLFGEKEDEYGDIEEDCYHKRSVLFESKCYCCCFIIKYLHFVNVGGLNLSQCFQVARTLVVR